MDEEEIKIKMDDGVARFFTRFGASVENEVSSSNCPNHVQRTKSSIKKRIIVRRTVRSMFGEQTFAQLRKGLNLSEGADRVLGHPRYRMPLQGATISGRVWRNVPESDAPDCGLFV